jgi:mannosyltransferase
MTTGTLERRPSERQRTIEHREPTWLPVLIVGVLAAVVSAALSWVPSIWYDEAATVVSATRSGPQLWTEIHQVDIVHATYYALMHVWFDLVGYNPFTLRLPSAIAIGIAAALVVVLGRMLVDTRTGVLAGVFFLLMPRVTWMGSEGRSFAMDTALAVAATILFVAAHRRTTSGGRSWPWWIAYTVVSLLGGAMFLYLALVTVGHGVTALVPFVRARSRNARSARAFLAWLGAAVIVGVALAPVASISRAQSGQLVWIEPITRHVFEEVSVTQWFTKNIPFACFGCVLAIAGTIAALWSPRGRALVAVALPWAAVPTLGLIAASLVTDPLYSPRYVAFAAPAAALCMAAPLALLPRTVRGTLARVGTASVIVAVIVAAALTAPSWLAQRTVAAKDNSAWNAVAALIGRERAKEPAGQHDAIVYGSLARHAQATSRVIEETYPQSFVGIADPLLVVPSSESKGLWETQLDPSEIGTHTDGADVVWYIVSSHSTKRAAVLDSLRQAGYHVDARWQYTTSLVMRFTR